MGPEVGGGGGEGGRPEGIFEAAKTVEYLLDHQSSDSRSLSWGHGDFSETLGVIRGGSISRRILHYELEYNRN